MRFWARKWLSGESPGYLGCHAYIADFDIDPVLGATQIGEFHVIQNKF
jgi:hypothetical protein